MLRVVTVNVNGIRAAHRRGGLAWLADAAPDVICLQEVRATHEQLHETLQDSPLAAMHVAHAPAPQLGRAGVAILTRVAPVEIREVLRDPALRKSGRWIEVDLQTVNGTLTIVSVYVHTGEVDTVKQVDKYAFLKAMDSRLKALRALAKKSQGEVIVCGDFNIAHHEVDIKNWRGNRGRAGFLVEEREYLDRWFAKEWVDLGRTLGGEGPGPYTWWSWRGKGFDTDGGWRIDYVMTTPGLATQAETVSVGKAPTYAQRWSDHAPLTVCFGVTPTKY